MIKAGNVFSLSGLAVTLALVGCGEGNGALPAMGVDFDGGAGGVTGGGGPGAGGSSGTAGATGSAGRGGSSSGGGGSTGTAGSSGSAGSPGTAGRGGAGGTASGGASGLGGAAAGGRGGNGGTCEVPACLVKLLEACPPPMGACTTMNLGLAGSNTCYANGVKVFSRIDITTMPPTINVTQTKPDGTPCLSIDVGVSGASAGVFTYKDADGKTIAAGMTTDMAGTTYIQCPGSAPILIGNNCPSMMGMGGAGGAGGSAACTMGACM